MICIALSSISSYLRIVKNANEFKKHFSFHPMLFKIKILIHFVGGSIS